MVPQVSGSQTHMTKKKVKSGCKTCKLRKIKCDERWPICHRCESTGRTCEGYGMLRGGGNACPQHQMKLNDMPTNALSPTNRTYTGLQKQVPLMQLCGDEALCFHWYVHRSASTLPGAFRSDLCTGMVLQVGANEPPILHAILALSAAHQKELWDDQVRTSDDNDALSLFTIQQYNKAIKYLQSSASDQRESSIRVVLMACALFIRMEYLREHYQNALVHLEHGLSLFRLLGKSYKTLSILGEDWLGPVFARFLIQAKLLGQYVEFPQNNFGDLPRTEHPLKFESVDGARWSLEHNMLRALCLREQVTAPTKNEYLIKCQSTLKVELQNWLATYEDTMSKLSAKSNFNDYLAYRVLRYYHRMAVILAGTCLGNEMEFDAYETDFLGIILDCQESYNAMFSSRHGVAHDPDRFWRDSISDIGWITPLYFTIIKCRNHRIRHQALSLLKFTNRKEGIWSVKLAALMAQKIIEMEEDDFYDHLKANQFHMVEPATAEELATQLLPEERRLRVVEVILPSHATGKLQMRCFRTVENGTLQWINKEHDLLAGIWYDVP